MYLAMKDAIARTRNNHPDYKKHVAMPNFIMGSLILAIAIFVLFDQMVLYFFTVIAIFIALVLIIPAQLILSIYKVDWFSIILIFLLSFLVATYKNSITNHYNLLFLLYALIAVLYYPLQYTKGLTKPAWVKKYRVVIITGLLSFIGLSASVKYYYYHKHQKVVTPILNPHPKYFVHITGNIQPHMRYPMTVKFRASYAGYDPSCQVWVNELEGIPGLPAHHTVYAAHPDAKGNYSINIPIDKYKLGKCQWKMAWIMIKFLAKGVSKKDRLEDGEDWGDMIRFGNENSSDELPAYPDSNHATLYCNKIGFQNCKGDYLSGGYVKSVKRNRSYSFVQNIS